MATTTFLNYYTYNKWYRNEVQSFEKGKVILKKRTPGKKQPCFDIKAKGRLMSYELGVPPFFLVDGRKIWVEGCQEPIVVDTKILHARATKNGLIFIRESPYTKPRKMISSSVILDGNTVQKGGDSILAFSHLKKIVPFQSYNSTASKFHTLNDISNTNLPCGVLTCPDPRYEKELYSIGRDGLLPPIVIKEEEWKDKNPMKIEYTLNHFSKGSIKVTINNSGRIVAASIMADSFWFTEEEILINRETDMRRDD